MMKTPEDLNVEWVDIDRLRPAEYNPREATEKVEKI